MPAEKLRTVRTLRAQWLGHQLRELREERALTLKQAAEYLGRNLSALSRYELAEWPIRPEDVQSLLTFYGVHDPRLREHFRQLADEVWRTDEWDAEFGDALADKTFVDLPWLEGRAARICSYEAGHMPGLLQTPSYAEAIIRAVEGPAATDTQVNRWVALRLERQRLLDRDRPPHFETVLDESVLRRPVGGAEVLRGQLRALAAAARRPRVEVRVLPLAAGGHPGVHGSFHLFEMPTPYPRVAYVESLGGRLYLETPRSDRFAAAYHRLRDAALDPRASAALLADLAEEA